ncbi:SDR family NAD(P)-dependent oxidoreductase [Variovorax sp. OV700]|uniref:SDR family NAD(P)-dependent oxidoreductase n=1 Tax=Variovorax sp. OV700 TaxID=1882826 RepID=UPI00088EE533|nr:SDR family oxidoreductase [Variovorax sp. OV700]SDJ16661.1 NAD(P)-dependent dehydrogenase, short-chain alcohol dehydrogenase family [Variovorax sp. OV700]
MNNVLKDRVFLVTGAAGGVGREIVKQLTEEGAKVVATDIADNVHELAKEFPNAKIVTAVGDVSKSADVEKIFSTGEAKFGPIESLINNAGYMIGKALHETSEEEWDAVMTGNAKSFFLCAKRALPNMLKAGKGSITATGSISSVVGLPSQAAYCASKGAVLQFVRQLAVEYAGNGIRVNAVGPGAINTPFLTRYLAGLPDPEAGAKAVKDAHPMKRWAEPDEVAKALIFLASDNAAFITGHILMVDGGYVAG